MNGRFIQCVQFLKSWNHFLELEPIRRYPDYCPVEVKPWIKILKEKKLEELVSLENHYDIRTDNKELSQLLSTIRKLISFPVLNVKTRKKLISNRLKEKKKHEIQCILDLTDHLDRLNIIDIGGGSGHLSENLVHEKDRFSHCVDQNQPFQVSGIKRISTNSKTNLEKIKFENMIFSKDAPLFSTNQKKSLVLGLHACGDLTPEILKYSKNIKADHLLSIGCCYQNLTDKFNLSDQAKTNGLKLSTNAFNLASRSHGHQTMEGLAKKIKIRTYRYGLHLYLHHLGQREFIPTGRTLLSDYDKSFEHYALKYAGKFITEGKQAQSFFQTPETQELIADIVRTDLLRGLFGRVIEVYLVLDRALYMQDDGNQVSIQEIFDRKLSPRNLAVLSSNLVSN